MIFYAQKVNFDKLNFDDVNAKYYNLFLDGNQSLYIENLDIKDSIKRIKSENEINLTKDRTKAQKIFYLNKSNQFYINSYINNQDNYLIKDSFEHNWKIENEIKTILNQKCQKATTTFRGRNYIAWFSTEIKHPFGPWKMNNLPGLILEVYDDQNFFRIDAVNIIKKDFNIDEIIKDYDLSTNISIEIYNQKMKQKNEDILNQLKKINPTIKMDNNCETCNKSLEIY